MYRVDAICAWIVSCCEAQQRDIHTTQCQKLSWHLERLHMLSCVVLLCLMASCKMYRQARGKYSLQEKTKLKACQFSDGHHDTPQIIT